MIAFDTATNNGGSGQTLAHTNTGSNLVLFVSVQGNTSDGTTTTVQYNSVSLTQIGTRQFLVGASGQYIELWYLINPSTGGSHNVVIGGTNTVPYVAAVSYTGAGQSGIPDATGQSNASSATTISQNITVVNPGCWVIAAVRTSVPNADNNGGVAGTSRDSSGKQFWDSNGVINLGVRTVSYSSSSANWGIIAASFPSSPGYVSASIINGASRSSTVFSTVPFLRSLSDTVLQAASRFIYIANGITDSIFGFRPFIQVSRSITPRIQ